MWDVIRKEEIVIKTIFLSISVALALILFSLAIAQFRNSQEVSQIEQSLISLPLPQKFTKDEIADLPEPVQRYFLHAIAPGTPLATSVKLHMGGKFRLAPDQPWLPMRSQETLTRKGFIWKAAIGSGLSQFQGADRYLNRSGRMRFAILGLVPVVNVQNPDTARSAIGRLVAELTWLPSALLPREGLQWSAIDDRTIQARLKVDDEPVTLTLAIDANGKLLQSSVLRWGDHTPDRKWAYIPMGSKCDAEQTFGGFTIPSQVGAGWWIGTEQYFEFFQAAIEQADFQSHPSL
jgi:hypothetical protein